MKYASNVKSILMLICLSILLSACASSKSGSVYSREGVQQPQTVKTGIIESVRMVKIEGTRTPIGSVAGTVIGGVAGSAAGGNRTTSQILGALGAVIGGLLGAGTEEVITQKEGVELTVQIDGGELVAIVQEQDANNTFKAGDTVRLVESGRATRVTH